TRELRSSGAVSRPLVRALAPLLLFVACVLGQGGCSCSPDQPSPNQAAGACLARKRSTTTAPAGSSGVPTAPAGTIPDPVSVPSTGEAPYVMPLVSVPGRAGVEPRLSLAYDSAGDDGILGAGFSLTGVSAITRCPQDLAQDGEIRGV